jgi:hypothetical protein
MTRKHGELETQVLDALWSLEETGVSEITSSDILDALGAKDAIALTTLLTVLSRLCDKGLVVRTKSSGRNLVFKSSQSREDQAASALLALLENSNNPDLVVSHFVGSLSPDLKEALRKSLRKKN